MTETIPTKKRNGLPKRHLPQSSSASRLTAAQAAFFILSQSGERPERYGEFSMLAHDAFEPELAGVAKYVSFALGRLRQYWPSVTLRADCQTDWASVGRSGGGRDPPFLLRRYAMELMSCSDVYGFGRKR
jgi:hypothetical protein